MELITLSEYIGIYADALARLKSLGVKLKRPGRLDAYLALLERMADAEQRGDESHQGSAQALNLFLETSDIIAIATLEARWLSRPELVARLRSIARGPTFLSADRFDPGRDAAFEFSLAARLQANGEFGGFSEKDGDLTVGDARWPLECKRISSMRALEKRLREARKQLESLYAAGEPPGVIAIDLSSAINSSLGEIEGINDDDIRAHTEARMTNQIFNFWRGRSDLRESLRTDAVLGVLARYVAVGTSGSPENVRTQTSLQLLELHAEGTEQHSKFLEVAELVNSAPLVQGTLGDVARARALYPEN